MQNIRNAKHLTEEQRIERNAFLLGRQKAYDMGGQIWNMIRAELMAGFGINPSSLSNRIYGNVAHTQFERDRIEAVFHKYGITEIWGRA